MRFLILNVSPVLGVISAMMLPCLVMSAFLFEYTTLSSISDVLFFSSVAVTVKLFILL